MSNDCAGPNPCSPTTKPEFAPWKALIMRVLVTTQLLLLLTTVEAQAYMDPGAGAIAWQILAAGIFGALFRLRKVLAWFRKRKINKD